MKTPVLPLLPRFRRFRTRLLVFLLALLLPVLAGTWLYVNYQNNRYTAETINSYLQLGADVFDFSREEQKNTLLTITSTLSRDWGFRNAFGTGDRRTIRDAARNLLNRSMGAADMLMITELDGRVIVDTAEQGFGSLDGEWQDLMNRAERDPDNTADAILTVDGIPYQVTVLPLFLPRPVAWVFGGFPLDNEFARTVKQSIVSDVSILEYTRERQGAEPRKDVIASTLDEADQQRLLAGLDETVYADTQRVTLGNEQDYGTLQRSLYGEPGGLQEIVAVIQKSYAENEANLEAFRRNLLQFYLWVVAASLLAVVLLSRTVTQPVLALARRVRRIDRGDYGCASDLREQVRGRDEIAGLADSIDSMASGLAEREKVRDLLGKVVSREIADELMHKRIELGGEEKEVTVLFVDIEGFTGICEGQPPGEMLELLNTYLGEVTRVIEAHHGVVDKYTGDAIMALFGAPVGRSDDPSNALRAVQGIRAAVDGVNRRLAVSEDKALRAGIGVHTGLVVAGNMGSASRMNYTVIGDAVNLAARLEALTRYYRVDNIVSGVTREAAAGGFHWCEIDRVRVKGRHEATRLYELLGLRGEVPEERLERARRFERALQYYRDRQWEPALDILRALQDETAAELYRLYIDRIASLRGQVDAQWDGVFTFDQK